MQAQELLWFILNLNTPDPHNLGDFTFYYLWQHTQTCMYGLLRLSRHNCFYSQLIIFSNQTHTVSKHRQNLLAHKTLKRYSPHMQVLTHLSASVRFSFDGLISFWSWSNCQNHLASKCRVCAITSRCHFVSEADIDLQKPPVQID